MTQEIDNTEVNNAFRILLNAGTSYLNAKEYNAAQKGIVQALSIKPKDAIANAKLTETLCYQCATKNEYCQEAKDYLQVMKVK